ncbi:uncharacterized protein LOC113305800 [Papaver somniferum]|uniref:uncharacterized protein LOC113305800 n=1 Tax=Papaver somniferum TaxID=3469 RepID=UPI000E6F7C27|nr:uncharacterized protein LOC113305800 [Papaver somniferum]
MGSTESEYSFICSNALEIRFDNTEIRFNTLERQLFHRLVIDMHKFTFISKVMIGFWILLEEQGFYYVIRNILGSDNSTVEAVFTESAICFSFMAFTWGSQQMNNGDEPFLAQVIDKPPKRKFFYIYREFLLRRLDIIMNHVISAIFDEIVTEELENSMVHCQKCNQGGFPISAQLAPCPYLWPFNPLANPHGTGEQCASSKNKRSMFCTFSKGYPLKRMEIIDFFNSVWGPVVENVVLEHSPRGGNPEFCRIIFKHVSVISSILNGETKAKFIVNGKDLWVLLYV